MAAVISSHVTTWSKLVDRLHKTVEARKIVQRPVLLKRRAVPVQLVAPPLQPLFVQWQEDAKRKKVKGQKRPARVDESNSEDDTVGEAIKKLATEGQQMASVMERMQDSQAQQIQLMSLLVRCFDKYMENNKKE